jgi:malonyl-CoA/methylmalonyl-CoA synthetase
LNSENNLFSKFAANWDPDTTFLTTPAGEEYLYGDVLRLSGQVTQLLTDLGIQSGDRVSVQAEKSIDYLWLYLGCLRGGFAFHPLNPAYTKVELDYFFNDAEPALVVYDPENKSTANDVASRAGVERMCTMNGDGGGSFRDAYAAVASTDAVAPSKPDDIAALLYSSGTTGQPKGIPLTHANIAVNAQELAQAWAFSREDVLLHALPMFHTHGLFIALNCTFISGSSVRYLPRFDAEKVIDEFSNATVMMGVPTYFTRLLNSPRLDTAICQPIRLFTSGSAPLREDTFLEFESRTGRTIVERYGMTETMVLTSNPVNGECKAGTVGMALPSVAVRIADDDNKSLPIGDIGRIQVRGPNVFQEYWRKPEKTAEDFTGDGYFDTGDQGRLDDEGYVSIVGRAKDLIISGGLNVYPIEVEQALNESPLVQETAVIGVPHADFGEAVVAVVIVDPGVTFDEEQVRAFGRERLASFKLPKRVIAIDDLPRNAMGKVQKNLLRKRYAGLMNQI